MSGTVVYEQPLVEPQVLHFMQVPLRTRVKFPHAPQLSPSKPFSRASAARDARLSRAPAKEALDDLLNAASRLASCCAEPQRNRTLSRLYMS